MPRFFKAVERNSPYKTRMTWKIPRSLDAEYFKYRFSSLKKKNTLNTKIWSTVYGIYASFWKLWRKTAHKQKYEIAQCQLPEITLSKYVCIFLLVSKIVLNFLNRPFQARMTWKMPRSSSAEYFKSRSLSLKKTHLTQKYEVQYTGNIPRSERPDAKQPINRNMKLHNVSYQRSLSQTMSAFSCIHFILLTIDMSSSSRIEKLPPSYSSESAEWKVLHKKKIIIIIK